MDRQTAEMLMYGNEAIEISIAKAMSYGQDPQQSIAFNLSAISRIMYNRMLMEQVKTEEEGVNG